MSERKHGFWKTFGWSATCSVCGGVTENCGFKYCSRCGAIMDEPAAFEAPTIPLPKLASVQCPHCGLVQILDSTVTKLFCPNCGLEMVVKS